MNDKASSDSYRWIVLGVIILGTFTSILTSSMVNVAMPRIMTTFGINREQVEWISTSFMLASAVAMPMVGWMVGRFGHKAFYLGSLAVFTVGTAACSLAWNYNTLRAARVVQAVGGGAMQPAGMAMVATLFAPEERGRAMGVWATGVMVGPALGPTVGGFMTEWFGWRSVFTMNLPFALVTLLFGAAVMRDDPSIPRIRNPFDWWGFLFLAMALIGGLLAFSEGQERGWTSEYIVTCSAVGIVGITMFLAIQATIRYPLLDLRIFTYWNYSVSMVLSVFRSVGLFGGMFFLPLFLQNLSGFSPVKTGLWMMPTAIMVGVTMPLAGRMADRYNPRWLAAGGAMLSGLSLIAYALLDPLSGRAVILGPQFFRGIGLAFMMAPLMAVAINAVPLEMVATASSFLGIAQRLGGSFGIALLNMSISNFIAGHTARLSEQIGLKSEMFTHLMQYTSQSASRYSSAVMSSGSQPVMETVLPLRLVLFRSQVLGFQDGFALSGLILLFGVPLCLMLKSGWHQDSGLAGRGPLPAGG